MLPLLRLLQDGRFHSGEALGLALGVSRAAIWKQLQMIEAELAVSVQKVRGRGYRLEGPLKLLNEEALNTDETFQPFPISVLQSVDSTNAEAMRRVTEGRPVPFVILAERQMSGRGRRGRNWVSPFGENLYYSLALRVSGGVKQIEGLSLVVGLALLRSLKEFGVSAAGLKWPNDVLVNGRKVAGILLELSGDPADECHVVVGIGVNVNMLAANSAIDQPWTSMRAELKKYVDRNKLVSALNLQMAAYLKQHESHGFASLKDEWQSCHLWQGKRVVLAAGSQLIDGVVVGVEATGAIRMLVDGEERSFSGGELSLRLRNDS
ncbi:bifunctional biotin--[acetyl-CoA-carboxylase] ligase/biotin operon repressor BirA [Pseudomonas borbori]